MIERAYICEVGPRDGLQMAKSVMGTNAKIRWIESLLLAGLDEIEVGSFVSPRRVPQMSNTAEVVRLARALPCLRVVALAPNLRGAQDAYAAGTDRISIPVSVSDSHSLANVGRTPRGQVQEVSRIVAWVRAQPRRMQVSAGCATAFGCSMDGIVAERDVVAIAASLAEAGVDFVDLADTVGFGHPAQVRAVIRAVRGEIGQKLRGLHLHNTTGLGLANAFAGVEEGIRHFDSALAGLGGCPFAPGASGNIVTEDLVFLLESLGLHTGINLAALLKSRDVLRDALPGEPLEGQLAKAGVPKTFRATSVHSSPGFETV
jgi:hydroxymethylglutaryl-CoA lyase